MTKSQPNSWSKKMKRAVSALVSALLLLSVLASPAAARSWRTGAQRWTATHPRDAYPWRGDTNDVPSDSDRDPWSGDVDTWGWPIRWCGSYVAWYEADHGHPYVMKDWAASTADQIAHPQPGWVATTRPQVGDIAVWLPRQALVGWWPDGYIGPEGWAGGSGHVGVVTYVFPHRGVEVAMYNTLVSPLGFDTERVVSPGQYLHPVT